MRAPVVVSRDLALRAERVLAHLRRRNVGPTCLKWRGRLRKSGARRRRRKR